MTLRGTYTAPSPLVPLFVQLHRLMLQCGQREAVTFLKDFIDVLREHRDRFEPPFPTGRRRV